MSTLKIGLVHPFLWPEVRRGGERYVDDLAWYLTRVGHRVEILTGGRGRDLVHGATVRRVRNRRIHRLAARGITEVETFGLAALPALMRNRYDVVHAFTPLAALAARASRQRTIYTLLGHPVSEIFPSSMHRRLAAAAVRRSHVTAALSVASAEQTARAFGRRARVLSPGVRLDRFVAELRPREGSPRILFPAAALPQKGLDLLLRAFARLLELRPDARLEIAGPGDPEWAFAGIDVDAARVVAAVDQPGVGRPEDLPERYRRATVTVLPSRDDAFGLVLIESLACGTPVVCCDAGGMPEIVDDPGIGRVVPYGSVEAIAEGIDEVMSLAGRPDTATRCRRRAERWDWETSIGPEHVALYREVAAKRLLQTPAIES